MKSTKESNDDEIVREIEKEKIEPKKTNNSKTIFLILTISICTVAIITTIILVFGIDKFRNLKANIINNELNKENTSIKYAETVPIKSDGVYITDVSEVVDEVMPSIVAITSKTIVSSGKFGPYYYYGNDDYTTEGAGSGVIVAEDDNNIYILTNYHVVEDTNELTITFINEETCDATLKGVSERKDIAIVSVSKDSINEDTLKNIKIAKLGNSNELKVGNGIIAIGNALGYGQSVTTGVVSALNREVSTDTYTQNMIQIDAAINGGNSGGALLNSKGEVVGINAAKYSSNSSYSSVSIEGMGFAIPISDVESLIDTLIKGENDNGGMVLGIEGYVTTSGLFSYYGLPEGFYISKIYPDSNAEGAGLEIGNIITEIDNNKVTSLNTIKKVLNTKNTGDTVTLKIKYPSRNEYLEKEVTVTLK